ncbi:MAG: serine/threonine protein kinase [Cyanobacteria bacterium SZAS TMP-1]|nr:serine/threonine protein kinase [Cyanobacteria bacterium SZAS TMP-1]
MPQTPDPELSKSRFFSVQGGTVVIAESSATGPQAVRRQPQSIIDKKYKILGMLGEGGMGAVFKAHHLLLNKDVALKTFRSSDLTDEARLRFQREAQAIAKLNHRNIVQIFDFGLCEDGVPYYTMEYLNGQTLAERIRKQGPLPVKKAIELFMQICRSLAFAHSKGIVHRDLKPANIFIESAQTPTASNEIVKIVDFGIASLTHQTADGQRLTTSGIVFGSPLYMSPEQALGQPITEGADIYSLGCALFETLTGHPPFEGSTALETIMMHQTEKAPTLAERSEGMTFSPALERLVATMLAKSPRQRQQSMEQVMAELTSLGEQPGATQQRSPRAAAIVSAGSGMQQETGGYAQGQGMVRSAATAATAVVVFLLGGAALWFINSTDRGRTATIKTDSSTYTATDTGTIAPQDSLIAEQTLRRKKRKDNDQPTAGLTCKQIQTTSGASVMVFNAPLGSNMGTFKSPYFSDGKTAARGTVEWPKSKPPEFCASPEFAETPANVDIFPPHCIFVMTFSSCLPDEKDGVLLQHLARQKWLTTLDFGESDIDNNAVLELDKLPHLIGISFRRSPVTGSGLARLKILKQLNFIEFCDCSDATGLINALARGSNVKQMFLSGSRLTNKDFKTLSKITGLQALQINKQAVTAADLAALAPLKTLKTLYMDSCNVSFKEAMPSLRIMKQHGLIDLVLGGMGMSAAQRKAIRELIPAAKFHCEQLQHPEAVGVEEWKEVTDKVNTP